MNADQMLALLALMADLRAQVGSLIEENAALRDALAEHQAPPA